MINNIKATVSLVPQDGTWLRHAAPAARRRPFVGAGGSLASAMNGTARSRESESEIRYPWSAKMERILSGMGPFA